MTRGVTVKRLSGMLSLLALIALTALLGGAEPLVAPKNKEAVNQAATANNDFAFDLYGQLAQQKKGDNLFFSPYSICNALLIVAEGARRETADEMGKALRLPQAVRRTGAEAGSVPWDLEPIHTGTAAL